MALGLQPPLHIPGLVVKACLVGHDSQSWESVELLTAPWRRRSVANVDSHTVTPSSRWNENAGVFTNASQQTGKKVPLSSASHEEMAIN